MRSNLLRAAAGFACGAVLLVGCGTGSAEDAPATRKPTAEPTEEATTESVLTCLQGDWLADNDQLLTALGELKEQETIKSITGTMTMSFGSDEEVITAYDEWAHEITEAGTDLIVTRDGTSVGIYRVVSPTEIEVADTGGEMTVTTQNVGSGETDTIRPVPGNPNDMRPVQVKCDATALVLTIEGGDLLFNRK